MKTEANDLVDYNPMAQQATGLTKREHFSGLAMQGYMANRMVSEVDMTNEEVTAIAECSVIQADALINALNTPAS